MKIFAGKYSTTLVAGVAGLIACTVLGVMIFPPLANSQTVYRNRESMEVGSVFEPRKLKTLGMEKIRVPAEEGITVVLFWATWSPRSRTALSMWEEYRDKYGEHPLTVITINSDNQRMESEDINRVKSYIKENSIGLPVTIDKDLELFNEIGIIVNPTTLFFDSDGKLTYKLPSFPSSARLDLKEELEIQLGLAERQTEEEVAHRGKLEYQPKNNALLYYNLGLNLHKKGFTEKARARYITALQRDPDYTEPLRTLEGMFFDANQTQEAKSKLTKILRENNLEPLIEKIGQGEVIILETKKKDDPMERMKRMMEMQGKQKEQE
jgi:tetratricopeptide (TPR) repeat protein